MMTVNMSVLLTEREARTVGYCTVEFFFRFFGPSHRRGPQTNEERMRPAVSSCTDRTSSVNKLLIILQKPKQFVVTSRLYFSIFVSFKVVSCCPKHYFFRIMKNIWIRLTHRHFKL